MFFNMFNSLDYIV